MERLKSHQNFVNVLKLRRRAISRNFVIHHSRTSDIFLDEKCQNEETNKEKISKLEHRSEHREHNIDREHNIGRCYLGLAVSKSVGNAVVRNHIKRQLRVLAREYEYLVPRETIIIIRPRPSATAMKFDKIEDEIIYLFRKFLSTIVT